MLANAELHEICYLVIELTKLRQAECKHLCIEKFAVDLFASLLEVFNVSKKDIYSGQSKKDIYSGQSSIVNSGPSFKQQFDVIKGECFDAAPIPDGAEYGK